jgi:hypothetical protein
VNSDDPNNDSGPESQREDEDEAVGSAAEGDTAVWDEETLRKLGLHGDEEDSSDSSTGPSEHSEGQGEGPSIEVSEELAGQAQPASTSPSTATRSAGGQVLRSGKAPSALRSREVWSWIGVIGLGVALGVVVFLVLRLVL